MEELEKIRSKINNFYDENGKLISYPAKKSLREPVLSVIAEKFECDHLYTEKEVNEIIKANIAFSDVELIRRELIEHRLLGRRGDGSAYWRQMENTMIKG